MSTTEPRDIVGVIDRMQKALKDEPHTVPLVQRLQHLKQSAMYTAPELQTSIWQRVQLALGEELGDPTGNPAKEKVARIFAGAE